MSTDALGFSLLLPAPRRIENAGGVAHVGSTSVLLGSPPDGRVLRAAKRWTEASPPCTHAVPITIELDRTNLAKPDHHRIEITPRAIRIQGTTPAACFWAIHTLQQLSRFHDAAIPCGAIEDWSDLPLRGVLHDVTRGKVPTLDTLKSIVDRLAGLKVNQVQLYVEHAFVFDFDRAICDDDHGLTPCDIRELHTYARERFIELVPAVATFGHMGRILSMPAYKHLAEIAPTRTWEELTWPDRNRGFTLDCMNPEGWNLVKRIWQDVLAAFGSPTVNLCGDEPWDLGKGRNAGKLIGDRQGVAYLDHIRRTHEFCASRGRRTQFWSDVVTHYPQFFDRVPSGATVLHWGYDDRADYAGTRRFVDAGLRTVVCPGTSGWKRVLNAMNLAERNITTFAKAAKECGAHGLLNTDWGDHGHMNALACSWHALALGAACAWRTDHPSGADFDRRFATAVLGLVDEPVVRRLRDASRIADAAETWRLLWQPLQQIAGDASLPSIAHAQETVESSIAAAAEIDRHPATDWLDPRDRAELWLACELTELAAMKMIHARQPDARADRRGGAERLAKLAPTLERCWTQRNKPSDLPDVLHAIASASADWRGDCHPIGSKT